MLKPKNPHQSEVTMTEMVLPNDTNTLNNLMGGKAFTLDGHLRGDFCPKTFQQNCRDCIGG
jgi:hypothetical protein